MNIYENIILIHMFQWTTKVSSKKHALNCIVCLFTLIFYESLPWPLDVHGSKISYYHNIVRQNVSCE